MVLLFFKNTDNINKDVIYNPPYEVPDYHNTIVYLSDNGFIKLSKREVSITLKGKMMVASGGFRMAALKRRLSTIGVVICVIASILAIIAYFNGTLNI